MHHLGAHRETGDVDLAIVAEEREVVELIDAAKWKRDERRKHRWRHEPTHSIVDVLPASPRIIEAGRLQFEGDDMELSMIGFDLALANTVRVPLDKGAHDVEVATLPALVVLKMVAWLDRPYERTKDLGDIARILDGSLDDMAPERWEEPLGSIEHEDQSAFFAGRQLAAIVQERHRPKIDAFFAPWRQRPGSRRWRGRGSGLEWTRRRSRDDGLPSFARDSAERPVSGSSYGEVDRQRPPAFAGRSSTTSAL